MVSFAASDGPIMVEFAVALVILLPNTDALVADAVLPYPNADELLPEAVFDLPKADASVLDEVLP
jgi:hypothetical protein